MLMTKRETDLTLCTGRFFPHKYLFSKNLYTFSNILCYSTGLLKIFNILEQRQKKKKQMFTNYIEKNLLTSVMESFVRSLNVCGGIGLDLIERENRPN